ncbi:MAG: ABC transporter permease, partial [Chthoniobacterales bacterium]|nr:ABC transporter permease [Chthoniobacterales bacterium]
MEKLFQDIRYGVRQLIKRPGFAALAVISMALGIGANTSIFSLVDTVLLRPLAVHEPARLTELYGTLHNGADITLQSYLNYKDYRDRNTVLSGLVAYRVVVSSLSHGGANQRVWGYLVSGNYFDVLGVKPALGRSFLSEEDQTPGSHPVAILSHGCWERRFGSDRAIIGQTVQFNSRPFTVIGVAPKGFIGTEVAFAPEMFISMMMAKEIEPGATWLERRTSDNMFVVGRLKPGLSQAQAQAGLQTLTAQLAQDYPENAGRGVRLMKPGLFLPEIRDSVFAFAGVLTAVGALVLLLACVNLANLLLARATERRKEIAVRLAVGASRGRLVRQLLTESVLISTAGGAAGVLLAAAINRAVRGIQLPTDIALLFDLRLDWRVLTFTLVLSLATGILFSLIPALQSSRPQLVPALKDESSMAGFRRSRLRNGLVVVQVSLSLVLLISAGLIVRSLQAAQKVRPGFNPENAVALSYSVILQGYDEPRGRAFNLQVLERARALPQVKAVAMTDTLPLGLNYNSATVYIEGAEFTSASNLPMAIPVATTPGYFEVMDIPLRGRDFRMDEDKTESRVAIVNETFARRFYPGQDVIGKRFNFRGPESPFWEIIGVVPEGKYNSLGEDPKPAVYQPFFRDYEGAMTLVARTHGDPRAALHALQGEVQKLDPSLSIYNTKTLVEHMGVSLFPARMAAVALGSFGVLALILAAVGIYGVMSHVVAGRTREIGLRMALGAQLSDVRRLILGQGMLLATIGSAVGLLLAFGGARAMKSLLYGVSTSDPITFLGLAAMLLGIALLASWIPASRASRVDPMIALRAE